jgi:hypothetical protein
MSIEGVDGTVAELGRFAEPLAGIQSRQGAYFVTGNHEYYLGFQPWEDEVTRPTRTGGPQNPAPPRSFTPAALTCRSPGTRVELGGLDLARRPRSV